jgi:hypothetical protein
MLVSKVLPKHLENTTKIERLKTDINHPISSWKKDGMIPGFIEGLEQLSFGDKAIIFIPSVWVWTSSAGE